MPIDARMTTICMHVVCHIVISDGPMSAIHHFLPCHSCFLEDFMGE